MRSTMVIRLLALAGLVLSAYALYVEHAKTSDQGYVAACDLNAWASCSRVFASPYGKGFGSFCLCA
jgi:vitamin-K-epoxide reductase (warfarin-sensitive)